MSLDLSRLLTVAAQVFLLGGSLVLLTLPLLRLRMQAGDGLHVLGRPRSGPTQELLDRPIVHWSILVGFTGAGLGFILLLLFRRIPSPGGLAPVVWELWTLGALACVLAITLLPMLGAWWITDDGVRNRLGIFRWPLIRSWAWEAAADGETARVLVAKLPRGDQVTWFVPNDQERAVAEITREHTGVGPRGMRDSAEPDTAGGVG